MLKPAYANINIYKSETKQNKNQETQLEFSLVLSTIPSAEQTKIANFLLVAGYRRTYRQNTGDQLFLRSWKPLKYIQKGGIFVCTDSPTSADRS